MGRGWAILKGGNRGIKPMRSVLAMRYGDLSDAVAGCSAYLANTRQQDNYEIGAEIAGGAEGVSCIGATAMGSATDNHRGSSRCCMTKRRRADP
jgi:hypothetical protein